MSTDWSPEGEGLSLTAIDGRRTADEKARDGKSGPITYQLKYFKNGESEVVEGKVTEVGRILDDGQQELHPLAEDGYTHYAVFRLTDRSTTIIVQNSDGETFKVFVLGRNNVKISHPVAISEGPDD